MKTLEITDKNIESFHFHGDRAGYPITAVIAVPRDDKTSAILRGRYIRTASARESQQIIVPDTIVGELLDTIFRIKSILDAVILVVAIATILALALVFALSLRLRQREIQTIFKLGCSRLTVVKLMGAEIAIILTISGAITALR